MYPSTMKTSSFLSLNSLAELMLYKLFPFLKKSVSGELMYFAKFNLDKALAPNAKIDPF